MIGTKHSFLTKHAEWGATEKTDMQHWARFPAWRPLAKQAKRQDFNFKNFAQRENIFMRWKEYFLVPDHRVRTITGASFEGFYYICLNQVAGSISGIYFHAKSEKYVSNVCCHSQIANLDTDTSNWNWNMFPTMDAWEPLNSDDLRLNEPSTNSMLPHTDVNSWCQGSRGNSSSRRSQIYTRYMS